MGLLVNGTWQQETPGARHSRGHYVRAQTTFRNWVTPDGSAGPSGVGGFKAEPGRYHLYVSYACPWAHRTLIFRTLKGLEGTISLSVTHWLMAEQGWTFAPGEGVIADDVNGARYMHEVYTRADQTYSGRASVPVLWDKQQRTIVNNESAEIIRMLNSAFDGVGAEPGDYSPQSVRPEIDALNARIYDTVNNGVYKSGFATTQEAYEAAVLPLFATLDWLELRLESSRFLLGDLPTEADWRLFTTLVRFDPVYHGHFKCNVRRIIDYPNLMGYTRDLYQWPRIRETVSLLHIKRHYYMSHKSINPTGIVPVGPAIDFEAPHRRERLGIAARPLRL
jgi:putative glutathione S-transferase